MNSSHPYYNAADHPHGVDRFTTAKTLRICSKTPGKLRFSPNPAQNCFRLFP
jgi:hypothetical protein